MMTMFGSKDGRPFVVIGLTKANHTRLVAEPINFRGPHPMPVQDFLILYGDDKLAILKQLESIGVEFAQEMKDEIARDPL